MSVIVGRLMVAMAWERADGRVRAPVEVIHN